MLQFADDWIRKRKSACSGCVYARHPEEQLNEPRHLLRNSNNAIISQSPDPVSNDGWQAAEWKHLNVPQK